ESLACETTRTGTGNIPLFAEPDAPSQFRRAPNYTRRYADSIRTIGAPPVLPAPQARAIEHRRFRRGVEHAHLLRQLFPEVQIVCIEKTDITSARRCHCGIACRSGATVIGCSRKDANPFRILRGVTFRHRRARIGAAVIDYEQVPIRQALRAHAVDGGAEPGLLIEHRHDDRNGGVHAATLLRKRRLAVSRSPSTAFRRSSRTSCARASG